MFKRRAPFGLTLVLATSVSAHAADHYEHDFSDIAKYVKAFEGPERDAWQRPDEVVSLLKLSPGDVVADIGAGTGYFEPRLSKAVGPAGRVLALDVEPHMVSYLRERARKEALANVTVQSATTGSASRSREITSRAQTSRPSARM